MAYAAVQVNTRVTGRRIVATLIDALVFSAFTAGADRASGFDMTTLSTGGSAGVLVGVALYYIVLEGFFGWTIGKLITGIRVIDADTGGRPGVLSAFVRTLLRLIDGLFGYLVAMIVVVNSDRRRRLGDMAAKTLVVRS